jgi:hypothetical protein
LAWAQGVVVCLALSSIFSWPMLDANAAAKARVIKLEAKLAEFDGAPR